MRQTLVSICKSVILSYLTPLNMRQPFVSICNTVTFSHLILLIQKTYTSTLAIAPRQRQKSPFISLAFALLFAFVFLKCLFSISLACRLHSYYSAMRSLIGLSCSRSLSKSVSAQTSDRSQVLPRWTLHWDHQDHQDHREWMNFASGSSRSSGMDERAIAFSSFASAQTNNRPNPTIGSSLHNLTSDPSDPSEGGGRKGVGSSEPILRLLYRPLPTLPTPKPIIYKIKNKTTIERERADSNEARELYAL